MTLRGEKKNPSLFISNEYLPESTHYFKTGIKNEGRESSYYKMSKSEDPGS